VTLNDTTTVLHLGDASSQASDFEPHAEHFAARRAAAAFPPHWFFDSEAGHAIIRTYLNADQVIGVHVPDVARKAAQAWRKRAGGEPFTEPGEKRSLRRPAEPSEARSANED
jgi:hypothetical protein